MMNGKRGLNPSRIKFIIVHNFTTLGTRKRENCKMTIECACKRAIRAEVCCKVIPQKIAVSFDGGVRSGEVGELA